MDIYDILIIWTLSRQPNLIEQGEPQKEKLTKTKTVDQTTKTEVSQVSCSMNFLAKNLQDSG